MQTHLPKFLLATLLVAGIFTSCQKDTDNDSTDQQTSDSLAAVNNKLKDTAIAYTKDLYLWYNQIPATFNAKGYKDLSELMTDVRQYSQETGFANPVDRWSFAMKKEEWDKLSNGQAGDFGLNVFFNDDRDLRVKSVELESPAGRAGIRRGWQIVSINGNSNISTTNTDYIVENVFNSASTSITFLKPDGTTITVPLIAGTYTEHPVYLDSVYNHGGKKIGYFVFNSFLGDTTKIYDNFQQTFNLFAREKITDLVVDLRYNGGGYVAVQNKLANYLAPNSADGGVMMRQEYNDKFTDFNSTDFFKKIGSLNLSRIFFIVSKNTASASELLINNLKPYMDVKLIGPSNTYGKPVGYFPIEVGDWYIFPVSFRSKNKDGEGNYFSGLTINSQVNDGLNKDWGDLQEACLARAVRYITTGSFQGRIAAREEDQNVIEKPAVKASNEILEKPSFKGMIETRGL